MYQILTRDEKKDVRDKFRVSKRGQGMLPRLNRLILEGLFLIVFSVALVVVGLLTKEMYWWMWTLSVLCLVVGVFFLIAQYIIRIVEYNNFIKLQNELKKKLTKRK